MGQRVAALAFLAVSAFYLVGALTFPLGSGVKPGPGFFPVGIGVFLCTVAILFLVAGWRRPVAAAADDTAGIPPDARGRVAVAAAGLVGFCLFVPWIGYPVAAFLFVALLLKALGGGRWPLILAAALGCAAASHYVFAVLLGVPLPRGILLD